MLFHLFYTNFRVDFVHDFRRGRPKWGVNVEIPDRVIRMCRVIPVGKQKWLLKQCSRNHFIDTLRRGYKAPFLMLTPGGAGRNAL